MAKKYDLIVVGGGPAGLMAAKTVAEDGLKVVLIERKRDVATNIFCGQFTNIKMMNVSGKVKYGYTEPLNLEIGTDKTRVHFPGPGFSIDYEGPLRPYYNYMYFSPAGYQVYREKDNFIAFFWEKKSLLAGLLASAEKAGVQVMTETIAMRAENTSDGVKVLVRGKSGEQTLEASKAIAADGKRSTIVESLDVNKNRQVLSSQPLSVVGYMLEGVETEFRLNSWINFTIPSLNRRMSLWMYMVADDRNVLGSTAWPERPATEVVDEFMKLPYFAPWFRHAQVVKRLAVATPSPSVRASILEPLVGNVLIIGDAGVCVETSNPGAIACGYQAAKATLKELNGQKGYPEYIAWWQKSFDCNDPDYLKAGGRYFAINALCSDEEVDYLYQVIHGQVGIPAVLIAKNLEQVKAERPTLYDKLKKAGMSESVDRVEMDLAEVLEKQKQT